MSSDADETLPAGHHQPRCLQTISWSGSVVDAAIIIYNERGAETNRRVTPKTIRNYCRDLYSLRAGINGKWEIMMPAAVVTLVSAWAVRAALPRSNCATYTLCLCVGVFLTGSCWCHFQSDADACAPADFCV